MFNITVKPDNGTEFEVSVQQRDILKWERSGSDRNITKAQENGLRLLDLYELAYHASVREGVFKGSLAKFESENELDFEEVEDDPNSQKAA